ncbi:putative Fungal-specific transcription factor domain-containing protein [Seiridium cardinale]|uniref:Fungal-specific transcription factor domain-containing protein n=1 Tax=Seiridium cardinale TaxID=138064 RepID=A0ABR2XIH8_9PEZI
MAHKEKHNSLKFVNACDRDIKKRSAPRKAGQGLAVFKHITGPLANGAEPSSSAIPTLSSEQSGGSTRETSEAGTQGPLHTVKGQPAGELGPQSEHSPTTEFLFVDNSQSARQKSTFIRSHAARRGKTAAAGNSSKNSQEQDARKYALGRAHPLTSPYAKAPHVVDQNCHSHSLGQQHIFGSGLSTILFAIELDRQSRELIHQWFAILQDTLYPPEFCMPPDITGSIWTRLLQTDRPYLHCVLAAAGTLSDPFFARPQNSPRVLLHSCKAYQLVNSRLHQNDALSNEAFAGVISLGILEDLFSRHPTVQIHLQGLHRMVELRGGLSNFIGIPELLEKLFRYA